MTSKYILFYLATFIYSSLALSLDPKLKKKIDLTFIQFDKMTEEVKKRFEKPGGKLFTRKEWEKKLFTNGTFSKSELAAIKKDQDARVRKRKAENAKISKINLSSFRKKPEKLKKFCEAFPKGGMLHVHPWGTLFPATVRKLLEKNSAPIPKAGLIKGLTLAKDSKSIAFLKSLPNTNFKGLNADQQEKFTKLYELPPGNHPFVRFEAMFPFVIYAINNDWENELLVYWDFAKRLKKSNALFVEFTVEPYDNEAISYYKKVVDVYKKKFGLHASFNKAFVRVKPVNALKADTEKFLKTKRAPLLGGIDLLAEETNASSLERGQYSYGRVLASNAGRNIPIKRTMHSGELGDPRNPRDSMVLGAQRLGHGVILQDDPLAIEYARRKNIAIEANLTSNLRLLVIPNIKSNPFLRYMRLGINVSLSTDDEGMFGSSIDGECEVVVREYDTSYSELKKMSYNSIEASFFSAPLKKSMKTKLDKQFKVFERKY